MKTLRIVAGAAVAVAVGAGVWTEARQAQAPAVSQDRAQDNRPPAGSPFSTLPGFNVVRVTPAEKTESYIVITFNAKGQPVVGQSASGNGSSPRLLIDANNDGIYEGEKIVSDRLNTCHGLFYEGNTLWANCFGRVDGDPAPPPAPPTPPAAAAGAPAPAGGQAGAQGRGGQGPNPAGIPGFYKLQDTNNDDVMDTIERITRTTGNGMGDHGPHAIRRGPDGSIMVMIGNNTYFGAPPVNDDMIDTAKSPSWNNLKERQFVPAFNDPRFGNSTRVGVHALLARLEANNKLSIQFSGMRNPYDFAYNLAGDAFVFDSDMEWDVNSPWYREVRTIHMVPGGDAGYRNGTGKYQDEYFDTVPALRHLRRGSPVGVETYQSHAYPTRFFDNLFEADWSRGRLLYTALTPAGGTYGGRQDLGEFVHGEPMPITDLEVAPDGNIYFSTGGSNTNGGLYKVVYTGPRPAQPDMTGVLAVVRQPQPLSSWAWANVERIKGTMGAATFAADLERVARNASAPSSDRSRALLEMQRHGAPPSAGLLRALLTDRDAHVRATVVYVAGLQQSEARAIAAAGLKDADPMVQRKSAEALVRLGLNANEPSFAPVADIYNLLGSPDRFVRFAARVALERTPRTQWEKLVLAETNVVRQTEGLLALINTKTTPSDLESVGERTVALMRRTNLPVDQRTRVLRVYEVMVTEMPNGATAGIKKQVYDALIGQFPTPAQLRAEDTYVACAAQTPGTTAAGCAMTMYAHHMAKVLGSTGEAGVVSKVLAVIPKGDVDQPGQIDYMYALRQVDNGWSATDKDQLIEFFGRASKWRGGSTFAGHVNNVFDATIDALTDAEKQRAYAAAPLFAPLTEQELQAAAAGGGRGGGGGGAAAGPGGPAAVAPAAAPPAAAAALAAPGGRGVAAPGAAAGGRGGNLPATARQVPLDRQERYDNLVFPRGSGPGSLAGRGGAPNATAGAQTFQQICAACHRFGTTGNTYGPDLSKIGQTALRRDILRSIFFPEEKVDDRYQTTVVTTRSGQTLRGLVINETTTSLMLVNADNTASPNTILKSDITRRTTERASIMPINVSDRVGGDANIANVVAFLMESR